MAKKLEKYFIALVPEGEIQQKASAIKEDLRGKFNLKYALKSPAHITLKMPFLWNELKEEELIKPLSRFAKSYGSFSLKLSGFWHFGNRVIFIDVASSSELKKLQTDLIKFSKLDLKLVQELSDRNYSPHMTVAFKDIKPKLFDTYWDYVKNLRFKEKFDVSHLAILKKVEGSWKVLHQLPLGSA
ncbi:2'-5' RNA ligase family protein [Mongoliibacter ruber]|uniref:2'-5' RNA ligase n=1 Tax=Mongoliibacter ruber TaxID=1750599 RepID=A0A2T0WT49_9BACT|nr:2'-5' RNA ligase family protein [Mongoliibacter ruber]PRY89875.1 2'-5' RNA ligase [Mongoliibacter ruber]